MRKAILTAVVYAAAISGVGAADLPRAQPMPQPMQAYPGSYWDGWYLGVNGGWGTGSIHASGFDSASASGFLGGIQLGVNKAVGPLVFGLVTDVDGGTVENSGNKLAWLGTTRGKLGYLLSPNTLVYGTGGAAYGGINLGTLGNVNLSGVSSPTVGWVAGAGIEFALNSNWGLGAEYLHVKLGGPNGLGVGDLTSNAEGDIFRGTVNYHF